MSNYARNSFNSIGNKREHADYAMATTKKIIKADDHPPSKVLHIRGLPPHFDEMEILSLPVGFGIVKNHIIMRAKSQAFVEMDCLESAIAVNNHYNSRAKPNVGGRIVYLGFSSHKEVKLKTPNPGQGNFGVNANPHDFSRPKTFPQPNMHQNNFGYPPPRPENFSYLPPRPESFVYPSARPENFGYRPQRPEIFGSPHPPASQNFAQDAPFASAVGWDATIKAPPRHPWDRPVGVSPMVAAALESDVWKPPVEPAEAHGPRTILKLVVTNVKYPVTVEVLEQVFQRCGTLLKAITFVRDDQVNAYVQFKNPDEAAAAKALYDGQNIYNGCNYLEAEFSNLDDLHVKYNNEKTRDYTNPNLPEGNKSQVAGVLPTPPPAASPKPPPAPHSRMPSYQGMPPHPGMRPHYGMDPALHGIHAHAGMPRHPAINPFPSRFPGPHGMMPPGMPGGPRLPHGAMTALSDGMAVGDGIGTVILCSNLNEDALNIDDLFILFGVYGNVLRIKVIWNKKDAALIQFADVNMASNALRNLNDVVLNGMEMKLTRSKHVGINPAKPHEIEKGLTKEYLNSPLHRFKTPGSKNFKNVYSPVRTLHLSNIPPSLSGEEIEAIFAEHGAPSNFQFFPKDRRMATIQMADTEEAIRALIRCHNKKFGSAVGAYLKVSFAKSSN